MNGLFFGRLIHESPRWMYATGDTQGGDKEIKRLARINRRQHVLTDDKLTVTVPASVSIYS